MQPIVNADCSMSSDHSAGMERSNDRIMTTSRSSTPANSDVSEITESNSSLNSDRFKVSHAMKVHQAEVSVNYIVQQIKDQQVITDPLAMVSCLYTFKALFEKAPKPRSMQLCFDAGFLSTLEGILEREFIPSDENNELVLYHVAMEILWWFSKIDSESPNTASGRPLMAKSLVTLVTRYTDVGSRFFQFSPCFSTKMCSLCRGIRFQRQSVWIVPVTRLIWDDILFYQPWMSACGVVPCLHLCSLNFQPKGNKQVKGVATQLIDDGLAWPKVSEPPARVQPVNELLADLVKGSKQNSSADSSSQEDEDQEQDVHEEDVFVLNMIGGHYFWAYVRCEASKTVEHISETIRAELPLLKTFQPQVGDTVVVAGSGDDDAPSVLRGRVMEVRSKEVKVLALDYGMVRTVNAECVYELSGQVAQLSRLEPQAKVCCLAGVHPPPASEATVELALSFLTNLTKTEDKTGMHITEAGATKNLRTLMEISPPGISQQSIRLLANLSSTKYLSKTVDWTPAIRPLLDMLVKMCRREESDIHHRNTLVAILYALINILRHKPVNKCTFVELNGQFIVLNVIRLYKFYYTVRTSASRVLHAAFPGIMKMVPMNLNKLKCDVPATGESPEESEEEAAADLEQMEMILAKPASQQGMSSVRTPGESSDKQGNETTTCLMPRHYLKQEAQKMRSQEEEEQRKAEIQRRGDAGRQGTGSEKGNAGSSQSLEMLKVCLTKRQLAEEPTGTPRNASEPQQEPAAAFELIPIDGVSIKDECHNYYEFSTSVPFQEGMTRHFLDVQSLHNVTSDHFMELVTGMLNSMGGTIYMGITKQGSVRGIKVSRMDRELVRLAIDKVMEGTNPVIPHFLIDVEYVPIRRTAGTGATEIYQDVCVVEIHIKPPMEKAFFTVDKRKACFQRFEADTYQLSEQDVREMVVMEEEKQYIPLISRLAESIRRLQEELHS